MVPAQQLEVAAQQTSKLTASVFLLAADSIMGSRRET
jgi:hypothetical protein